MDKEMSYEEFREEVHKLWLTEDYVYGSLQWPAKAVTQRLKENGVTNAQELLDRLEKDKGDSFYYSGD